MKVAGYSGGKQHLVRTAVQSEREGDDCYSNHSSCSTSLDGEEEGTQGSVKAESIVSRDGTARADSTQSCEEGKGAREWAGKEKVEGRCKRT